MSLRVFVVKLLFVSVPLCALCVLCVEVLSAALADLRFAASPALRGLQRVIERLEHRDTLLEQRVVFRNRRAQAVDQRGVIELSSIGRDDGEAFSGKLRPDEAVILR